jgi:solute carrier family 25 (mitochondrial citrate transporter), member 1
VWQGTKMILAKEGIRGVYQGLTATVLKQSSNQGLRFMWFTEYKRRLSPDVLERNGIIRDAKHMTATENAVYSLVGGISAGIFSVFGNNRTYLIVGGSVCLSVVLVFYCDGILIGGCMYLYW